MKKFRLFKALSIFAIAAAVAVAVGVGTKAPKVEGAEAADGDPVGYYLVGDGSFKGSGDPWTNESGVQMVAHGTDKAALYKQYLTANDVFKITNSGRNEWYGIDNYKSGGSEFGRTSYSRADKSIASVGFDGRACSWWYNDGSYTVVNAWGGASGHGTTSTRIDTTIDVYTDNTTIKFERSAYSGNYAQTSMSIDWSSKNTFVLNSSGNGGSWMWYDENGTNIIVKTSGYYNIYLNGSGEIYINDAINEWAIDYLHMNSYDKDGQQGSTGGDGSCTTYYWQAKEVLLDLGQGIIDLFRTDSGSRYTNALLRYNEWARINNDATPFESNLSSSLVLNRPFDILGSSDMTITIVVISLASVSAVAGLFFIRKRKHI